MLKKAILTHKQIDNIVNLTNTKISPAERSLLLRGLSFVPTPESTPKRDIMQGLSEFIRKMKLRLHFHFHPIADDKEPFKIKSAWEPSEVTYPPLQEFFDAITNDITSFFDENTVSEPPNLTCSERVAITRLASKKEITIRRADKGGAIVLWPTASYLQEANNQLSNQLHYKEVENDGTQELANQITTFLTHLLAKNLITEKCYEFLEPSMAPRTPIFYLLPKIHKPMIHDLTPGRPIVSGCGSPTEKISQFLDYYLKPIVETLPSFIKDSNHFLQIIFHNKQIIKEGIILATLDVKSLYTNIPQNEGIQHCLEAMNMFYGAKLPLPVHHLKQMFEFVLKGNYFTFNKQYYLQQHGTSMGTPFAPNFANIFMSRVESKILTTAPGGFKPLLWIRFIDDIFMIWQHGEQPLAQFLEHVNSIHDTIKFVGEYSWKEINFLDTTLYFNARGEIESTLFIKPTDICTLLQAQSYHPSSCKRGVIYSQALRYRRLITDDRKLGKHLKELESNLIRRGYDATEITSQFAKLSSTTQAELLFRQDTAHGPKYKNENTNKVIPFIVPYDSGTAKIGSIIKNHWHLIEDNPVLQQVWNNIRPVLALKRRPNLKDLLVKTK